MDLFIINPKIDFFFFLYQASIFNNDDDDDDASRDFPFYLVGAKEEASPSAKRASVAIYIHYYVFS